MLHIISWTAKSIHAFYWNQIEELITKLILCCTLWIRWRFHAFMQCTTFSSTILTQLLFTCKIHNCLWLYQEVQKSMSTRFCILSLLWYKHEKIFIFYQAAKFCQTIVFRHVLTVVDQCLWLLKLTSSWWLTYIYPIVYWW